MEMISELPVRHYEGIYILQPSLSEEQQKVILNKSKAIIEEYKGEVNHIDTWGQRHLANPIKKFNRGTYFHITFKAQSDGIKEIERTFRINDKVLRFMHTKLDERISLEKHVDAYKEILLEAKKRHEEKENKFKARDQSRRPRKPVR
jgi:small subunit ribosomal protein S6